MFLSKRRHPSVIEENRVASIGGQLRKACEDWVSDSIIIGKKGDMKWHKPIPKASKTVQSAITGVEVVRSTHLVNESPWIHQVPRGNVCCKAALGKARTSRQTPPVISGRLGLH